MDEVIVSWKSAGYLPRSGRIKDSRHARRRRRIAPVLTLIVLAAYIFNSTVPPRVILAGRPLPKADVLLLDTTGGPMGDLGSLEVILRDAGLSWVQYSSLGIDSLRAMPSGGYRLIILKAHSGPNALAISERYSLFSHMFEQVTDRVGKFRLEGVDYFSVRPEFVRTLDGKFDGATILLMGCNTLASPELAKAFLGKGAAVVVGWKGLVTPSEADLATLIFLEEVLKEGKAASSAVSQTMSLLQPYLRSDDELTSYSA